ncbi:STAS domain-containing protein [Streptomyces sp. NPDC059786]|uniref:STAS domain-containing protein n=1 Tax=Streptomyces sp. NPDC059786 TaxID=3346946 RepID=UPI00364EC6B4
MPFAPTPRDLPNCTLLALPPEIDISNAATVRAHTLGVLDLRRDRLSLLVLDLTGTRFMDSQGVRLINEVRAHLHPPPRTHLRVAAEPDGLVSRLLELTGLRRDIPVYDDLAEAIEAA